MGRAAGAVLTAAAPEAKAARAATAGRRRRPAPASPAPGSQAARHREAIEQIKAQRQPEASPAAADDTSPAPATSPPPASPGGGPSLPQITLAPAAQTGSGFLLGLFLWGWVGLPYLRGGSSEVRRTLAAKFLNKSGG